MTFPQPGFFCERSHSHHKRSQKRKLTIFGTTKQVIKDYDTVFDNSIPFRENDLLRITYFRIPGVPGLHFVPGHRGSECLGAAALVTWADTDEYNLNVVDCNTSVTVARRSSISVSGGRVWGVPPAAAGLCDFVTVEFVVTESSTGPRKPFRERTRNSKEFRIEESRGNLAMTSDVGGGHLPESL